jgi:hypothetical protein
MNGLSGFADGTCGAPFIDIAGDPGRTRKSNAIKTIGWQIALTAFVEPKGLFAGLANGEVLHHAST